MFYSSVRSGEEYSRWDSGPVDQVCFTVVSGVGRSTVGGIGGPVDQVCFTVVSGVGRSTVGGIVDQLIRYVLQ